MCMHAITRRGGPGRPQREDGMKDKKAKGRAGGREARDARAGAVHTDESTLAQEWPFETDFNDHFETPKRAYRDIRPALRRCVCVCARVRLHGCASARVCARM